MAVSKSSSKKAPNQNPVSYAKSEQFGGALGKETQKVPDQLTGGPMREKIFGRKDLSKQ